jgi:4Fe-4S ferredoxin
MGTLAPEERAALSFFGRLKARAHRNRQAYVVRPGDCHACQLCIAACPEQALRFAPRRG